MSTKLKRNLTKSAPRFFDNERDRLFILKAAIGKCHMRTEDYTQLESRVKALELIINSMIHKGRKQEEAQGFNLAKELKARGLTKDPGEIKRIEDIVRQYARLTPDQICGLLDKITHKQAKETIGNLPGYINNAFRREFTFYHTDYDGMNV